MRPETRVKTGYSKVCLCIRRINPPPLQGDGIFTTTFATSCRSLVRSLLPSPPPSFFQVPSALLFPFGFAVSSFVRQCPHAHTYTQTRAHTHIHSKYFHPHILKMSAPIYGSNGPNGSAKSEELGTRCFCIYLCIYVYVHIVLGTRPKLGNKLFCFPMFSGHGIADTAKGYDDREKISDIN